jgi:hypothetical protein
MARIDRVPLEGACELAGNGSMAIADTAEGCQSTNRTRCRGTEDEADAFCAACVDDDGPAMAVPNGLSISIATTILTRSDGDLREAVQLL